MEGNCQDVATKLIYIYTNAQVLGKVWNGPHIDADRRQQSLTNLRTKTGELSKQGNIRPQDAKIFSDTLDLAEELNKKEGRKYQPVGHIHDESTLLRLQNLLKDNALEMAIHSIADCECTTTPTDGNGVRTGHEIGATVLPAEKVRS